MKQCNEDCPVCCDNCKWYEFNGDKHHVYIGRGFCKHFNTAKDPIDWCDEFHCRYYEGD